MSRYGHLVTDTRRVLQSLRDGSAFLYVKVPNANTAAHRLANVAKQIFMDKVWMEETTNCIRDVILKEQSPLSLI